MDEALPERVRTAIADARTTVGKSQVLAAAMRQLRDPRALLRRCAWCDRYAIGDVWLEADETPRFFDVERLKRTPGVTDSICPDCTRRVS